MKKPRRKKTQNKIRKKKTSSNREMRRRGEELIKKSLRPFLFTFHLFIFTMAGCYFIIIIFPLLPDGVMVFIIIIIIIITITIYSGVSQRVSTTDKKEIYLKYIHYSIVATINSLNIYKHFFYIYSLSFLLVQCFIYSYISIDIAVCCCCVFKNIKNISFWLCLLQRKKNLKKKFKVKNFLRFF